MSHDPLPTILWYIGAFLLTWLAASFLTAFQWESTRSRTKAC